MNDQATTPYLKHTYVPAFDGLRGTVLTVLFFHLEAICPVFDGHPRIKFLLFSQTWYTLNIFFCLSGFLITWLLANEIQMTGQLSLLRFYKRRTVRLLPAYLSALIFSCWLAYAWGNGINRIFHDAIYFLTYSYNIGASLRGGLFVGVLAHFLGPAWSLCVEEQFYFAWSVVMKWLKMQYLLRVLIWTLIALEVYRCGLLYYMRHAGYYSPEQIRFRFYYGTDIRIDAILMGCVAALALQNRKYYELARKYLKSRALPYLLPVAIAWTVFHTAHNGEQSPDYQLYGDMLSLTLLAAWIVCVMFQPTSLVSQVLASRPFVLLGRISYGLYIFHYQVIRIVERLLNTNTPPNSVMRNLAAWFLVVVISTLIATVHLHLIELPLQRRFKGAMPIPDKPKRHPILAPAVRQWIRGLSFADRTQHPKS